MELCQGGSLRAPSDQTASSTESQVQLLCCRHRLCAHLSRGATHPDQFHKHLRRGDRLQMDQAAGSHAMRHWIVVSGMAAFCKALPDGRRQILDLEMPGDLVARPAGAPDGTDSWVEILCDSIVCEVDLSADRDKLDLDLQLTRRLLEDAWSRLEAKLVHVVALGRLDSMERICLFLLEMAQRSGTVKGGATRVSLCLSRDDIADYLGLNAETVSRLLGRIKKAGLAIFLSPTEYAVPDMKALAKRVPIGAQFLRSGGLASLPKIAATSQEVAI